MAKANLMRDSYHASVWIPGDVAAFLESLYPNDELGLQVAQFLQDAMVKAKRRDEPPRSVIQLVPEPVKVPEPAPEPVPQPLPEPVKKLIPPVSRLPKPEFKKVPLTQRQIRRNFIWESRTANAIAWLNQYCQKAKLICPEPTYKGQGKNGQFGCRYAMGDFEGHGLGESKKKAQQRAAWELLRSINDGPLPGEEEKI